MDPTTPNDQAKLEDDQAALLEEAQLLDKKADEATFPDVPVGTTKVHDEIRTTLLPTDSPEALKQRLLQIQDLEELKRWVSDYWEAWIKLPVIQTFFKITHADENAFRAQLLEALEQEVPSTSKISEIIADIGKNFFEEESSAFGLNFQVPTDDHSIESLTNIAILLDVSFESQDFPGDFSLRGKIEALETLYKKEAAGTSASDYLASIDLEIFQKQENFYKEKKYAVVNFYNSLTDQGRANLALLIELGISFYAYQKTEINNIDTNLLTLLLPIKAAGLSLEYIHTKELSEDLVNITAQDVEIFCAIYGNTDHNFFGLKEIAGLSKFSLTPNAIKAIRLLKSVKENYFDWQSNVEHLNKLDDKSLRGLEVLKTDFRSEYHLDEAAKFKILEQASAKAIEIIAAIKTLDLSSSNVNFFVLLEKIDKYKMAALTEESLKIINFILEFIDFKQESYSFPDSESLVRLMIRAQRVNLTLAEFKEAVDKVNTSEPKAETEENYKGIGNRSSIIDWVCFLYGGGLTNFSKLYEADVISEKYGNRNSLLKRISEEDPTKGLTRRLELLKVSSYKDVDLKSIAELSEEDVEKCIKLKKYFKNFTISDAILPWIIKELSQEQWLLIEKRFEKNQELFQVSDPKLIQKIIELDEQPFERISSLYNKMPAFEQTDSKMKCVLSIIEKYTEQEMPEIIAIIEKSRNIEEIEKRLEARHLFGENLFRLQVFDQLLIANPNSAGTLLQMSKIYGDDEPKFKMTAFACKNGLQISSYNFDKYKEAETGKVTEDNMYSNYIRSLLCGEDYRDLTRNGLLTETFEQFPELNFIENLNETNALFALMVYSKIDEAQPDENASALRKAVGEKIEEGKKIILQILNQLKDKVLEQGAGSLSQEEQNIIKIVAREGVPHFKILERSADYINMLLRLDPKEGTQLAELSTTNVSLFKKFTLKDKDKDKNINYSNNDYVSFYEKCIGMQNLDTSVLLKALQCFDALALNKENFDFMQEQLLNTCSVVSMLIKSIGGKEQQTSNKSALIAILEELEQGLKAQTTPLEQKELLKTSYSQIGKEIVRIFEEGLGLQNLPEISPEIFEQLVPYLTYLSNIHDPDNKKRAILSLFILLRILNKGESFKRGETIEVEQYLTEGPIKELVLKYLKERQELDLFEHGAKQDSTLAVPKALEPKFMKALTEKHEAILVGESRGILDTLTQIETGYRDLEDPDNFNEEEKVLLAVVGKFGSRQVGKALSERYKNPSYEDDVTKALPLAKLENEKSTLPRWQKIARILGSLLKFNKAVEEAKLKDQISFLEKALLPSTEIVEIFRQIGEEMSTESGVMPINEDVEHLESILHKKREELSPENFTKAQQYIDNVKQAVLKLNNSRDTLGKEFIALVDAAGKTEEISNQFKSRLDGFKKLFMVEESDRQIKLRSTMTGDLADVIPHIRQCLGCQTRECNNDTNLTFGDRNRYSVITREFHMPEGKSISDELVTLQMTTESATEGETKRAYSFLMDNVYGKRDRDILIVNILTVLNKLKALKKAAPDISMDIFVTDAALSSCAASEDYVRAKVLDEFGKVNLMKVTKTVHVGQSASGDGHYEIGGGFGGRVATRSSNVQGIKISL